MIDSLYFLIIALSVLAALPLICLTGWLLNSPLLFKLVEPIERLSTLIDSLNEKVGRTTAWFVLAMVLIQTIVVIQRYVFGIGSIALQESIVYLHATLFMLASGFTLLHDGHVRVDIIYRRVSPEQRAWINFIGSYLFLFPLLTTLFVLSLPYVQLSWSVREGSAETSGIQAIFLLKSVILVFAILLFLQGISLVVRSLSTIVGRRTDQERIDATSSV